MNNVRIQPSADLDDGVTIGDGSSVWHLAQVRHGAELGENVIVGRGAYIGEGVHVGNNCKIQNYALVYEPAHLEDGVFIGPAVVLTNDHFPRAVNPDGTVKSADDWEPVGVTLKEGCSVGARATCVAPVLHQPWADSRKSWAKRCSTPPALYTCTSAAVSRRQVTGTLITSPLRRLTTRIRSQRGEISPSMS